MEQEESPSALYYVGLEELRQHQAQVKAATEDEAKELAAPVIELSRLLEERLAIREVIPSPAGDAIYVNTWKREDLVYIRTLARTASGWMPGRPWPSRCAARRPGRRRRRKPVTRRFRRG